MKIRNILFPVDFSERCKASIPYVEAAARRFGSAVTLLHLVEPQVMPYGLVETLAFPGLQPGALKAKAEDLLDTLADSAFAGMRVRRVVETGDPASSIVSLARDWEIGLIMMPTRGRGAFRKALLGSVAAKVLHDSDCPVWTSAHVETPGSEQHIEWRNIVCALSLSKESARLIQTARDLHDTLGSTIHIVHAVPGEEAFPQRLWDTEFENVLKEEAEAAIRKIQCQAGSNFEVHTEAGDVSRAIACYARQRNADLVLAGRGLERGLARLRSHTYAIVRDAPCPVLSV